MEKKIEQDRNQIRKLYQEHPFLVNDTKQVVINLLKSHGLELTPAQKKAFYGAPSVESMYRSCRIVRAENDGKLAKEVIEPVRQKRFNLWKLFSGRV